MSRGLTLACCLVVIAARSASGQELHGYVGGAIGAAAFSGSSIKGQSPSTTYDNTFEKGRVTGAVVEAGAFGKKRFSIGFETWLPFGRKAITQAFNYSLGPRPYRRISSYREQLFFLVLRADLHPEQRVRVAAVGGAGFVFQNAVEGYSRALPGSLTVFGPFEDPQNTSDSTTGFMGGLELVIEAMRHLQIVPQLRVVVVQRGENGHGSFEFTSLGLDRVIPRIGVGVRARF